jgi:hypothetical protein
MTMVGDGGGDVKRWKLSVVEAVSGQRSAVSHGNRLSAVGNQLSGSEIGGRLTRV